MKCLTNTQLFLFFCFAFFTVKSENCDTTRVKNNYEAANKLLSKDVNKSLEFAKIAFLEANNCINTRVYYESALTITAVFYQQDKADSIIAILQPILNNLPKDCPIYYRAAFHHRLSSAYIMVLNLKDGLYHCLEALKHYEKINNKANTVNVLVNIANVYQQQRNFKQADKYLREAEKKALEGKLEKALGNVYNTMGILYAENDLLDSAERFFLLSTTIRENLNDNTVLAWNYNNLGGVYVLLENPKKAIIYFKKALEKFEFDNNFDGQTSVANNLGELYMQINDYKKAFEYFSYSRQLYTKTNNPDNLENLYHNLINYYRATSDNKTALLYADSLLFFKDSLYGNRLDKSIAEMQTKFDVEKKDLEIASTKTRLEIKEKENFIKNIIIISGVLVSILVGGFIFLTFKRKRVESKLKLESEIAKQNELRSKAIIDTEEKERVRIAKDLHDGVGQLLSATKLNLNSFQNKISITDKESLDLLNNAMHLVDESVKEVRSVSHSMMPNALIKHGLAPAVKEFINRLSVGNKLNIDLEIVGLESRLEANIETILFRVLQEIVSNIIKHAKANYISVQLIQHNSDELTLMVEDNGVGFDTSKIDFFEGIGLKNIQSRINFLNGTLHFDSTINKGTTVVIEVPLK